MALPGKMAACVHMLRTLGVGGVVEVIIGDAFARQDD